MGQVWYIERSFGDQSPNWRLRKAAEGENVKDAVIVKYFIFNLQGDGRQVLEMDWRRYKNEWTWLKPAYVGFHFNLDTIRTSFPELLELEWLQGPFEKEHNENKINAGQPIGMVNNQVELEFTISPDQLVPGLGLRENVSTPQGNPKDKENYSGKKRVAVPDNNQTYILTKSRRRCSICFGLNKDLSVKRGQISHLDRDPGNNEPDNLVWLCLEHHDQYDSKSRQSKGLTQGEVRKQRKELYDLIEAGGIKSEEGTEKESERSTLAQNIRVSGKDQNTLVAGHDIVQQIHLIPPKENAQTRSAIKEPKLALKRKIIWGGTLRPAPEGNTVNLQVIVSIENKGTGSGKSPSLDISIDPPYRLPTGIAGDDNVYDGFEQCISPGSDYKKIYRAKSGVAIHPGDTRTVIRITHTFLESVEEIPDMVIRYRICAEDTKGRNRRMVVPGKELLEEKRAKK